MSGAPQYFGRDLEAMSHADGYYRWILREFSPYIRGRILEVGAGSGTLTEKLLQTGAEHVTALEPSGNMFPLLQSRFSGNPSVTVRNQYLSVCATEFCSAFDTVLYINVLEHVEDDRREMAMASECLAVGGHLLIFVPAMTGLFGTADELFGHFRRYTKTSLLNLFRDLNTEVRRCRYFDVMGMALWWLSFVLIRAKALSPAMVRLYDRIVVPWVSVLERVTDSWPAGKNLLLVARKRA